MNISIIIPNYNGEKLLEKNLPRVLEAVREYKNGTVEIIIPDDPSSDNSKAIIMSFFSKIKEKHITGKTIENKKKSEAGFTKNITRGVSLATGDVLILLNSDVVPHKDFLNPLLKHFADEKVFGVGCMDESVEDDAIVLRGRGIGKWRRGFLMHQAGELTKTNTLWVSGGSGAFRKRVWDMLHGLDPLYNPFYWEDIDISYRALKSGYKIYFEKESIVTHEHEKGAIKTKYSSEHIKKISYRNQFIFVWKNITDRSLLTTHFLWLPYHLVKAISRNDMSFLKGFVLALFQLSTILQRRAMNKKIFIVQDKEVLKNVKE